MERQTGVLRVSEYIAMFSILSWTPSIKITKGEKGYHIQVTLPSVKASLYQNCTRILRTKEYIEVREL